MIATDTQHYPNPDRNVDIFEAEWDALSTISKTSWLSERVSIYDGFRESEDCLDTAVTTNPVSGHFSPATNERDRSTSIAKEWTRSIGNDRLDLILTTSSLTEGSCISLHSECDLGDDDILSTVPFDEEVIDSLDGMAINDDETIQSHGVSTESNEPRFEHAHNKTRENAGMTRAEDIQEFTTRGSISYAQLFFDPETKALVTLMEISNDLRPARPRRIISSDKNRKVTRRSSRLSRRKSPLRRSSVVLSKNESHGSRCNNGDTRDVGKASDSTDEWDDGDDDGDDDDDDVEARPFQDETLSTECSSMSSATGRKHDRSHNGGNCDDDWGFSTTQLGPPSPTRFPDEPVVFSNDGSMNQRLCWLDETDISLFLLQGCDDPWDYGGPTRGNARCGESLKKLLNASRLCISLPQLGESKWRISSPYHRTLGVSNGNHHNSTHNAKIERISYSILNDI